MSSKLLHTIKKRALFAFLLLNISAFWTSCANRIEHYIECFDFIHITKGRVRIFCRTLSHSLQNFVVNFVKNISKVFFFKNYNLQRQKIAFELDFWKVLKLSMCCNQNLSHSSCNLFAFELTILNLSQAGSITQRKAGMPMPINTLKTIVENKTWESL